MRVRQLKDDGICDGCDHTFEHCHAQGFCEYDFWSPVVIEWLRKDSSEVKYCYLSEEHVEEMVKKLTEAGHTIKCVYRREVQ